MKYHFNQISYAGKDRKIAIYHPFCGQKTGLRTYQKHLVDCKKCLKKMRNDENSR